MPPCLDSSCRTEKVAYKEAEKPPVKFEDSKTPLLRKAKTKVTKKSSSKMMLNRSPTRHDSTMKVKDEDTAKTVKEAEIMTN